MLRRQLKAQAKVLVATSRPRPLVTALIYVLVGMLISMMMMQIMLVYQESDSAYEELTQSITDVVKKNAQMSDEALLDKIMTDPTVKANSLKIAEGLDAYLNSPVALLLTLALAFISQMLSVGMTLFSLNTTIKTGQYSDLLGGFSFFLRLVGYVIIAGLFTFLWSLLFIIPGIIASYRYRMGIYLLIEHPECSPLECIRRSSRMMKGNKMELFVMDLSFLGWQIVISMAGMLGYAVQVWYIPYYEITNALFYRHLCAGLGGPGQSEFDFAQ